MLRPFSALTAKNGTGCKLSCNAAQGTRGGSWVDGQPPNARRSHPRQTNGHVGGGSGVFWVSVCCRGAVGVVQLAWNDENTRNLRPNKPLAQIFLAYSATELVAILVAIPRKFTRTASH